MNSSSPSSARQHWHHKFLLLGTALMLFAVSCSSDAESQDVVATGPTTTSAPSTSTPIEAVAAPRNDLFENAVVIDPAALPFTDSVDTAGATSDDDDVDVGCPPPAPVASVWYSITPTSDQRISLNGFGTEYPLLITVAAGDRGAFEFIHCRPFSWILEAEANVTYHINFSADAESGGDHGGNTVFTVDVLPEAPENDLREDAQVIDPDALPFTSSVDTSGAGGDVEDWDFGCPAPALDATIWYTFTPTRDMRLLASGDGSDYPLSIGAYPKGGPFGECRPGELFFDYEAGTTYYIQLFDGQGDGGGNGGNLEFSLEEVIE